MSWFFALPNIFGILGPIISSILIPFVGFWPVFCISIVGLLISYLPLVSVNDRDLKIRLSFSSVIRRLIRNKTVFLFEFLENIIEESEWFWSIYVFLIIGSLTAPGIVGSCQAIGGSLFTLIIGHYVNKKGKQLIPLASLLLLVVFLLKIVSWTPLTAYIVTVAGSFMLSLFVVSYYSAIYRTVKSDDEEEFMVIREISTVAGRIVVFGAMFLLQQHLRYFFILPIFVTLLLLVLYRWRGSHLKS
ncbi:hypothetical protein HGB07_09520 [Candidatus Roizmanbacteria bacterium]|nr:hypothetical protein [Candidatus Roizmanbacteria bacterium]